MLYSTFIPLASIGILANLAACNPSARRSAHPTQNADIQHLSLDFKSRSQAGKVSVTVQPNNDNVTAFGLNLIYSAVVPDSQLFQNFHGFPVVKGAITYPIPANPTSGYASLFGWIQFIKADITGEGEGNWTVDGYPYAQDLKDPFGGWGYNPSHFDAPAILLADDGSNAAVVWRAQTFLCELQDAGVTKNVTVLPGGAFTWGFNLDVNAGNNTDRNISLTKVALLDVETEWLARLPLLREQFTEWDFHNFTE
jgi:hypothetical protein